MAETEVIPNDLNTDPVPGLQSEQNEVLTTAVHSITSAVQTVEVSEPAVSFMAADGAAEVEEDGSALQSIDMSGQALFIVTPDGQQIQLSPQQAAAFVSQQANGHFIMETGGDQDVEMQEQSDCDVKDDHLESVEHDHSQEDLGVVDMNKDNSFAVHDQKSDQSSSCLVPQSSVILEQGPGIAEAVPGSSAGMSLLNMGTQGVQGMIINPSSISQIRTSEGETIQVIAVQNADQLLPGGSRLVQLVPGGMLTSVSDGTSLVALGQPTDVTTQGMQAINTVVDSNTGAQSLSFATSAVPGSNTLSGTFIAPTAPPPKTLLIRSSGAPGWACRMNDCEKIGDSYRGWVETEVQLDLLLTYHKQQTQSFWGTRQSPSPAKQSTRLMWKSQYAPFDGIPFVNSGSRAIVLECQYGPRRKGAHLKKQEIDNPNIDYKQTCPARIYIKKVKKFPEYAVNIQIDKKILKSNMDKSFEILRKRGVSGHGQERFYVQLPTEKAHEFHGESEPEWFPHRLHPAVANKIREYVSCGETRLYAIRKMLRRYVEKELFGQMDGAPEKHNLSYFPTVNDLQNHIHQAVKDVETGELPLAAQTVNLEVVNEGSEAEQNLNDSLWQQSSEEPHAETVTVTLTQNPNEDGQHLISRVETHLSDGSTVVSSSLTPETAKLLSRLHPNMFPTNILQQEVQPEDTDTDLSASISMETDMTVGSEESCSVVMPQVVDPEAGTIMIKTDDCAVLPGDNDVCGVLTLVQQDGQVALQVLSSSDQDAHVGLGEGGHLEDDQIVGVLDAGGVSLVKTEVQDEVEQLPTVLM